ncbi:L-lysine exporter [Microbacterium sp. oral taxon 186 str. F0373]|uniref:LysE/ArgO family amino acid transporter n=1 Tax=Microbacterium sp. oral taxon 186 TaxID=712383 RepID=UPI00034E3305|nr:LysE/ArgO family amino acid transporter [Microbacterium sp. oral taxon 186]EPD84942.1 L-lysine exporter [Microbacterium sp. oral taxon 186 str. F0373]
MIWACVSARSTLACVLSSALAGLGLGLSLIVAIGAQNLFVLRQGIRRQHVTAVVVVCTLSDALLIMLGVSGVGAAVQAVPGLIDVVRWAGALFLAGYAFVAARRALRGSPAGLTGEGPASEVSRRGSVVLTCLALTWLNPHVYLDTVFLLGAVANTHGSTRWAFAAGAVTASVAWFCALGFGARRLGRRLATPRAWRVLDGAIAVVMLALAVSLVLPR